MAKTKKYSLPYFCKRVLTGWNPMEDLIRTVEEYIRNGNRHPQLDFAGTADVLATELYYELYKRSGVKHSAIFPTPLGLADDAAWLLELEAGDVVMDFGAGWGNLMFAARRVGSLKGLPPASVHGVDFSQENVRLGKVLGLELEHADILSTDGPAPWRPRVEFTKAITNPPFGKAFNHPHAQYAFLDKIADCSHTGTRVVAILPAGFWTKDNLKLARRVQERYSVLTEREYVEAFKPLASVTVNLHLLKVERGGVDPDGNDEPDESEGNPLEFVPAEPLRSVPPVEDPEAILEEIRVEIAGLEAEIKNVQELIGGRDETKQLTLF